MPQKFMPFIAKTLLTLSPGLVVHGLQLGKSGARGSVIGLRNPVSVYICYHVMTVLSAQKYHNILLKIYSIEEEKIFKNTINLL